MSIFDKFNAENISKYKELLAKVKEFKVFREDGMFKVKLKLDDGTEVTTPLKNYKMILDALKK